MKLETITGKSHSYPWQTRPTRITYTYLVHLQYQPAAAIHWPSITEKKKEGLDVSFEVLYRYNKNIYHDGKQCCIFHI
jgi:hypothetical protein